MTKQRIIIKRLTKTGNVASSLRLMGMHSQASMLNLVCHMQHLQLACPTLNHSSGAALSQWVVRPRRRAHPCTPCRRTPAPAACPAPGCPPCRCCAGAASPATPARCSGCQARARARCWAGPTASRRRPGRPRRRTHPCAAKIGSLSKTQCWAGPTASRRRPGRPRSRRPPYVAKSGSHQSPSAAIMPSKSACRSPCA